MLFGDDHPVFLCHRQQIAVCSTNGGQAAHKFHDLTAVNILLQKILSQRTVITVNKPFAFGVRGGVTTHFTFSLFFIITIEPRSPILSSYHRSFACCGPAARFRIPAMFLRLFKRKTLLHHPVPALEVVSNNLVAHRLPPLVTIILRQNRDHILKNFYDFFVQYK